MNLFRLSDDNDEAARYHDDTRVIKGCLEAAQAVATGLRIRATDPASDLTHREVRGYDVYDDYNRPNAMPHWAAESRSHLLDALDLCRALSEEYRRRWDSDEHHGAYQAARSWRPLIERVPDHEYVEPPFYGPREYRTEDLIQSYRLYYAYEKGTDAEYVRADVPDWWYDDAPQPTTHA